MFSRFIRVFKIHKLNSKIDLKRNVRKSSKNIEENNEKAIETIYKQIDLNSSQLPPSAQIALKSDPEILSNKDELKVKELKFDFDQTKFDEALAPILEPKKAGLEEDSTFKPHKANCSGCGSLLQCSDKKSEGFVDARKMRVLTKQELKYTICFRCEFLKRRNKLLNVTSTSFDYDKFILKKICSQKKAHIVILIDLLDLPNSIYEGWSKLIQENSEIDIIILGNKFDLLPNTGPLFMRSIFDCLLNECAKKGLKGNQIKHVDLISAKTGFNIEKVISKFFNLWNDEGDVYLLGMANAGKSVFFNKLLSSDYCRPLASEALVRATTSFWPGTTLNNLKFPINFLTQKKSLIRKNRLESDLNKINEIDIKRSKRYEKTHVLNDAQVFGLVNSSFKKHSVQNDEINFENPEATYSINEETGLINEVQSYESGLKLKEKIKQDARHIYKPEFYKDKSTWFYDTPGVLGSQKILQNFSKQELEIVFPIDLMIPRIYWMIPGQSLFVGGLIRIDLLESTQNERVLFSIMSSPALPVINPFNTQEAEELYEKYYNEGNVLRVPYKHHVRNEPLPALKSKTFEISCIGNYKATSDIVFSCFGWTAVTSRPDVKAKIRAFTLGGEGLALREPSLLPFIVNMRRKWDRKDGSQSFKSIYYKKPDLMKYFS